MTTRWRACWQEILLGSLLFSVVSIASVAYQPATTINSGRGWDGVSYYRVAQQFAERKPLHGQGPFVYRIGTPALAAILSPQDLIRGFYLANLLAAALLTALMLVWLRTQVADWRVRTLLLALFLTSWIGPVRFIHFCPVITDPWALVFCLAGLICIEALRSTPGRMWPLLLLSLIAFVGPLFRETAALVGLAAIFASNPVQYDNRFRLRFRLRRAIPFLCTLAGVLLTHAIARRTGGYSFVNQVGHWIYHQSLMMYAHAWLITFGPLLFLLLFAWRETGHFFRENQGQLVYLAGVIGLGWIGGADTERFATWAAPVLLAALGHVIEKKTPVLKSAALIAVLAVTQVLAQRLFWTIPEEVGTSHRGLVLLTPLGGGVSYLNLFSHYGSDFSLVISFAQYCALGVLLLVWLGRREHGLRYATCRDTMANGREPAGMTTGVTTS